MQGQEFTGKASAANQLPQPSVTLFELPPNFTLKVWRMPSTGKPCHNCRRRRLRCDRSWPSCHKCAVSGQECLGYGKVFVWTQGIDSNGNLKPSPSGRRAIDDAAAASSSHGLPRTSTSQMPVGASTESSRSDHASHFNNDMRPIQAELSSATTAALTDPLFQDLDRPSRYYLAYCKFATFHARVGVFERTPMFQVSCLASSWSCDRLFHPSLHASTWYMGRGCLSYALGHHP